jgi:hypothetical protein
MYTTNYIPNPSLEISTTGYTPFTGTLMVRDTTTAQFGSSSLKVSTDGITAGEGFLSPQAVFPSSATGSASIYLMGQAGSLTISAVTAGGAVLSSITVQLSGVFTRYELDNLAITGTNVPVWISVATPSAQKLTFWADSLQAEPESPATPYCDGSQAGCTWNGTPGLSTSFRQYQFGLSSTGGFTVSGHVSTIVPGQVFTTAPDVAVDITSGTVAVTVLSPVSVFDDFAVFELADNDPAMTYGLWNNAGVMTGYNNYNEGYGYFVPPLDYPVSGGEFAWRRAAFAAVGFVFANLPVGQAANITNVQVEFPQINGTSPVSPRPWQTPRVINTTVKPNRLNYVANPSFELNSTGWATTGSNVTITQDATTFAPQVGEYGNLLYNAGAVALKVTMSASGTGQGTQYTVSNLIIGRTYTASAYVQPGTGIADVVMTIANGTGNAATSGTPYGDGTFGGGQYGGEPASLSQLPTGQYYRPSCTFTATADSHVLALEALEVSGASYPVSFWVDAVLVEDGEVLQPYFDGSFGVDAFWEGSVSSGPGVLWTFDPGLGTWTAFNGTTLTTATTWAYQGTTSALFHGDGVTAAPSIQSGSTTPVSVGNSYTATAWSFSFQGWASGLTISLDWRNSSGTHLSTTTSSAVPLTLGAATFLSVTGTAPSSAAFANVIIAAAGTPASTVKFQVDEIQVTTFTVNSGRSYYYKQFAAKQHMVQDTLTKNTPLGILSTPPVFAEPFTQ